MAVNDTKTKILDSALRLFSEKGFIGATTREIADSAGVAELTLFRHFLNKENLFEQALKDYSFLPELEEIIHEIRDLPYEEGLLIVAKSFYKTLKKRKDIIKIVQSEMQRYPEKLHKAYHSMIDGILNSFSEHLKDLQKRGILRDFDTFHAARGFLGLIFSFFNMQELLMRSMYRQEDEETILKDFIEIFSRGTMKP